MVEPKQKVMCRMVKYLVLGSVCRRAGRGFNLDTSRGGAAQRTGGLIDLLPFLLLGFVAENLENHLGSYCIRFLLGIFDQVL